METGLSLYKNIYIILILLLVSIIIYIIYTSWSNWEVTHPTETESKKIPSTTKKSITNAITESFEVNTIAQLNDLNFADNIKNITSDMSITNIDVNNQIVKDNTLKILNMTKDLQNNQKLSQKLLNDITELEIQNKKEYVMNKPIKTIKSRFNDQELSVKPFDNNKYNILANDKCLTVKGLCVNEDYCLLKCQDPLYSSNSQKFYSDRVTSNVEAARIMGKKPEDIVNNSKITYPYNVFRSAVTDNCLSLSNDGITVEKCNLNNIKQHWLISPDETICLLN